MKYQSTITGFGPEAFEFLSEKLDLNFIIIFNEDAPEELAELSILHSTAELAAAPVKGDTLKIGPFTYEITAVGTEAAHTLEELGHCTLMFDPAEEAFRPGCIMLKGEPVDKEGLKVGDTIEIL